MIFVAGHLSFMTCRGFGSRKGKCDTLVGRKTLKGFKLCGTPPWLARAISRKRAKTQKSVFDIFSCFLNENKRIKLQSLEEFRGRSEITKPSKPGTWREKMEY